MIDTIHLKYSVKYTDIKWEHFEKIKSRKGVYKADDNTILFNYYSYSNTLFIILNAHRVLEKFDVNLSDLNILQKKIDQAMVKVVDDYNKENLELMRCDFCA